jgi:hypothetical protein
LGYAAEVWSRSALARHVREHAVEAGYPSLHRAAKATVQRILAAQPLHPEKVKYYLERRDPNFEAKMREVLLVDQEVALQNQNGGLTPLVITVSVDEKRVCRPSLTPRRICHRCLAATLPWVGITSTSDWGLAFL